jgi:AraC-like DNA-binding protein
MEFALHVPGAPLDRHVESLTFYSGYAPTHHREKLIPDGAIQIIVDLTETPKKLYAGETSDIAVDFRRAWISGMQQRWIVIEAQQASSMLVIRFRPGGAYAFVHHDADALESSVHPLDSVLGDSAVSSLRDRVLAAQTIAAKFTAAEAWLAERAAPDVPVNAAVAYLARRLDRPVGLRIRDLAEEVGFTERHLLSLFRRWIGTGPKQYARIARFGHVLGGLSCSSPFDPSLRGGPLPDPDWAAIAAQFGYADQSHLSHDFRAFAGMTPGDYVAAYRGLTNYLPITLPGR